jgi:hypothetical protein
MVNETVQEARWRIEERATNGAVLASASHDDRERAFESFAGWRRFLTARAASHGNHSPVEPFGAIRLVLIDRETHVIGSRSVVDGPAL